MTGGGNPLCQKSYAYLLKIIGLSSKKLKQKFLFRQIISSKGAILIEFAFCLPVLIVLVYYIYDLNRYKRYYSQTEFVAQQVASMIQNISQSRESKALTKKDLQRIARMAFLSIYPGMSMYLQNGYFEFGHAPMLHIIYVKGLGNGNASCMWSYYYRISYNTLLSNLGDIYFVDYPYLRPVHYLTNVAASEIYPSLTISPGEVKIIVISQIHRYAYATKSPNGKYLTDKQAFNFYLLNPKYILWSMSYFFPSVVIFTPRPGLFSETPPI